MVGTKTNLMLKMQFYMETWRIPIYIQRERERETHTHTHMEFMTPTMEEIWYAD
jgi:hypothetical protein